MTKEPPKLIHLKESDYDFSLECPEFRERLFTEFKKQAESTEAIPLSDEELALLNAAGQQAPPVKPRNEPGGQNNLR